MKNRTAFSSLMISLPLLFLFGGCAPQQKFISYDLGRPLVEEVLSKEEQAALTPDEVVKLLKDGNQRFVAGDLTVRDHSSMVRQAAGGQFPKAVVLSCIDSRVPVEDVFDRGIGDLFVARVAGNFENEDILGSMEFATKVAGAKVVLVLGHAACGAVKGAIDQVELGNITPMLENIEPAIVSLSSKYGERSSSNKELLGRVIDQNVVQTMEDIRKRSAILRELEENGDIKIIGGVYDLNTGRVTFFE